MAQEKNFLSIAKKEKFSKMIQTLIPIVHNDLFQRWMQSKIIKIFLATYKYHISQFQYQISYLFSIKLKIPRIQLIIDLQLRMSDKNFQRFSKMLQLGKVEKFEKAKNYL
jgi:hypothetical protein